MTAYYNKFLFFLHHLQSARRYSQIFNARKAVSCKAFRASFVIDVIGSVSRLLCRLHENIRKLENAYGKYLNRTTKNAVAPAELRTPGQNYTMTVGSPTP